VRIANLVLVQTPQFRPAPRGIGIALRDAPERVSGYDDISVRRVGLEGERRARRLHGGKPAKPEESERCDRLTQLLDHVDPVLLMASWAGSSCLYLINVAQRQ